MRVFFLLLLSLLLFSSCGTESENKPTYTLSTTVNPTESGTINPSSGTFESGESVTLTSTPNEHWVFHKYEGDYSSNLNPSTITMDSNKHITSVFVKKEYTLNLTIEGEGTVEERLIQNKSTDYEYGSLVELTGIPKRGWGLSQWSGDIQSTNNPIKIEINGQKDVNVEFLFSSKSFGGNNYDYSHSINNTLDGGYIITGYTDSNDGDFMGMKKGIVDTFIIKVNPSGTIEWVRILGGSIVDIGESIIQTSDNGFVITGHTQSNDGDFSGMNKGNSDIYVIKLNSSGETQWVKTYGGSGTEIGRSIVQTESDDLVLTGYTQSIDGDFSSKSNQTNEIFIIKLNPSGDTQWIRTLGGEGNEESFSISNTSDGGTVITGFTTSDDGDFDGLKIGDVDTFVIKLDSTGNTDWIITLGGSSVGEGRSIIEITNNEFIITGYSRSNDGIFSGMNKGDNDIFVIKLNSSGQIQWVKTFGGSGNDYGNSVTQNSTGDILLTGYTRSDNGDFSGLNIGTQDLFVISLDTFGDTNWVKTFGGSSTDFGKSIDKTVNDGVIVSGYTESNDEYFEGFNKGIVDIFIFKLNSSGNMIPFNNNSQ